MKRLFPRVFRRGTCRVTHSAGSPQQRSTGRRTRRGFTLLEVLLSLSILAGAVAVLGELARMGIRNAQAARDLTRAEVLCESKVNEVLAGIVLAEPVTDTPFDYDPGWLYTIELLDSDEPDILALRVTVAQEASTSAYPVSFSLVRWMIDPTVLEAAETAATEGG